MFGKLNVIVVKDMIFVFLDFKKVEILCMNYSDVYIIDNIVKF